jgi:hypothetical protein
VTPERPATPSRYQLTFHPSVAYDLEELATHGVDVVAAVSQLLDDLAHARVTGKELGERRVSGDLSGFFRLKFDGPGERPQRFRLVYRSVDPVTYDVLAVGLRDRHAIYQAAVRRLAD